MRKNSGILTGINSQDLDILYKNPTSFWNGVNEIGEVAFPSSDKLTSIDIPSSVAIIQDEAFSFCQFLKVVKLNKGIKSLKTRVFLDCDKLETINIPSSVEYMGASVFMGCNNLKNVTIENGVYNIPFSCFYGCGNLAEIDLPQSINSIDISAFTNCFNLKSVSLHEGIVTIDYHAFENCKKLEKIYIPDSVKNLENKAFEGCISLHEISLPDTMASSIIDLQYLDFDTVNILGDGRFLLLGEDKSLYEYPDIVFTYKYEDIKNIYKAFPGLNLEIFIHDNGRMKNLIKKANYFNKLDLVFPCELLDTYELFEKYTNKNFKMAHKLLENLNMEFDQEELEAFYKLANNIGLLEDSSVTVVFNGKNVPVNVVAQECLQRLFNNGYLDKFDLRYYYLPLLLDEYNEEFLKFMQRKDLFPGLRNIEMKKPHLVSQIYRWYKERKELSIPNDFINPKFPSKEEDRYKMKIFFTNADGVEKERWRHPTLKMFVNEFSDKKISLIPEGYEELAEYLEGFGYHQKHFDKAVEIDKERIEKKVRNHILNIELKENDINNSEEYALKTECLKNEILREASEVLDKQIATFTYEMLSKNSKENYAIGLLSNCCAILYGAGAGAQKASIIDENMQSLVIRDNNHKIIGFGIIYVNREEGYAVINNLEINHKYKTLPSETEQIYNKVIKGVEAFVEEYNKENPTRPINIVTCGTSPSWASEIDGINFHIKKNRKISNLPAPDFDSYKYAGSKSWKGDWHREQFVIYDGKKRGNNR